MNHLHDIPECDREPVINPIIKNKTTSPYVCKPVQHSQPNQQRLPKYHNESKIVQNKIINALDMLKETGTTEEMTQAVNNYAESVGMNKANRDLLVVLKTEGPAAMIKQAFVDPHDSSRQMSYSEMRAMYG